MSNEKGLVKTLNLWQISIMGVAYMTPMVVFDTFGIITEETGGHVPAAYIFTLIAILFTALSYGDMVRAYPIAGSAYTYAQQTLNPMAGFMIGWATLLDYLLIPVINVILPAIYLGAIFPSVNPIFWVIGMTLVVTLLNLYSVKLTANVGAILVGVQFVICFIFVFLATGKAEPSDFTLTPFLPADFTTMLAGAAILTYSFLGFDSVSTLAEDTINPRKNVPRGVLLTALIGGGLFTLVSYFGQILYPDASMFDDVAGASPQIALELGGRIFQSVFVAGATVGVLASGLVSHLGASRLLYAMGRDNIIPRKVFGYVSNKTRLPSYNIIIVGIFCISPSILYAIGWGTDAIATLIFSLVSFGALVAFSMVNLAVIIHYFIKQKRRSGFDFVRYFVSPLIGFLFIVTLWLNLDMHSLTVGLIWTAIGLVYIIALYFYNRSKNRKFEVPTFHMEEM